MTLKFGTSGVRGLVTEFTDQQTYLLTTAFLKYADSIGNSPLVSTGMDLRESSPQMLYAAHRAIKDAQKVIFSCGKVPTPALAYFAQIKNSSSVMITGSHIPTDRNGIKFYLQSGETLKSDDEKIFTTYHTLLAENFMSALFDAAGNFKETYEVLITDTADEAKNLYTERYTEFFPERPLLGMKALIYQHSSVARDLLVTILESLGASTISLGRSDVFIPVDTEAVDSLAQFKQWIKEYQADCLVSTDGDGDRPLLVDDIGNLVQGDKLGILTCQFLGIDAIALPISCNSGISQISAFSEIVYTKIGSPYVVEALNRLALKHSSVAGFEANGGFILKSPIFSSQSLQALATRDSVLPLLACLVTAATKRKKLHNLISDLPGRYTSSVLAKDCPGEKSNRILTSITKYPQEVIRDIAATQEDESITINYLDGIRITTSRGEIIHFRPSGNAPEFRCYTEAATQERAEQIAQNALRKITEMINSG